MALSIGTALLIGGGLSLASSAINAGSANRARKSNAKKAKKTQDRIDALEANRQEIINPFSGMRNLSDMVSNPMANLQVATEAAEFQAEESDIALANTLDTLRATGAGAGGATALAQGALRSKRGIAASIAQQEAANAMARAQGEQSAQAMRISEARRMQSMQAQGRQYVFETQENRDMAQLDRLAGLQTGYEQNAANARAQRDQIWGQAIPNAIGSGLNLYMAGQAGAGGGGGGNTSDRRLKNNIKLVGYSPSGLKIYNFSYIGDNKVYQGVMSDEIPQHAVVKGDDGYDKVYYDKIDVEFKLV